MLFLPSCEGKKDKDEYTFIVETVEHFHLNQSAFTFKENDFSPITFKYTIDMDWEVTSIESGNECDCSFDSDNLTITVTPKENIDFTIKPVVKYLDNFSHVLITGSHFTPEVPIVNVRKDDFATHYVNFELEDGYQIQNITSSPSDAVGNISFSNSQLRFNLIKNGDCEINLVTFATFVDISFNPIGGELDDGASPTIKMSCNAKWSDYVNNETQKATYKQYKFLGWSMRNGGHGSLISPDYVIRAGTPPTVYAVYEHQINITSESLAVNFIDYSYDNPRIMLGLKNEKYDFPLDETAFTVTNEKGEKVDFEYKEELGEKFLRISQPSQIDGGIININVVDYQPDYKFSCEFTEDSKLKFVSSGATRAKKGEDFTFKIESINQSTNDVEWCIPYKLNIYIGSSITPLSSSAYKIDATDEYRTSADVTIFANYVRNDIKVTGSALEIAYYRYECHCYGVDIECSLIGFKPHEEDFSIQITSGGECVDAEHIMVNIDGIRKTVDELPTDPEFKGAVTYDPDAKTITIHKPSSEIYTDPFDSIELYIVSTTYSMFESAPWEVIDEISTSGKAERFFKIGEEKHAVEIDNQRYTARVIGFDHNSLKGDDKNAGMTVEFEEVITNSDGAMHRGEFGSYKCNYFSSRYNNYLTNTFQHKIPNNIFSTFKEVVVPCESSDVFAKIFALSSPEINCHEASSEGSAYEYYQSEDVDLTRHTCSDSSKSCAYWLRSRKYASECLACYIKSDGSYSNNGNVSDEHGYIVAFCI